MVRIARALPFLLFMLVLMIASPSSAIIIFPQEIDVLPAGSAPGAVAVHPALPRAYVANTGDGTVTTFNTLTGETVRTEPVGPAPHGIAVNPVLNRVYVAIGESNFVAILSATTGAVIQAPINIPNCRNGLAGPWGVAVHPITGIVYVACETGGPSGKGTVWAINGISGIGITSRPTPGTAPLGVALDPTTNLVYVGYAGSPWIDVFDGATLATVSTIRQGLTMGTWGVAVDPVTHRVAAVSYFTNTLYVWAGGRNILKVGGLAGPEWIAFDSLRNRIWVPENKADRVTAVDATTGSAFPVAISGTAPTAVAVHPVLGVAYSANFGTADVSVIL